MGAGRMKGWDGMDGCDDDKQRLYQNNQTNKTKNKTTKSGPRVGNVRSGQSFNADKKQAEHCLCSIMRST